MREEYFKNMKDAYKNAKFKCDLCGAICDDKNYCGHYGAGYTLVYYPGNLVVTDYSPIAIYNYKCPKCHGEFNEPARDAVSSNSTGNPRCPWCGERMKGL